MYEGITIEAIRADILSAVEKSLSVDEGSFACDMASGAALALYKAYKELDSIPSIVWVDETSGRWLDEAARDAGIDPRKQATAAEVTLLAEGDVDAVIPSGSEFYTEDNIAFKSVSESIIDQAGKALVPAQAVLAGVSGNVRAGSICSLLDSIRGIKGISQPEEAMGGAEAEGDAALYKRIDAARKKPQTSGNIYDYEKWALSCAGIGAVKVFPLWNGNGTVKVLVVSEDRQPVDDEVSERCFEYIEEKRPIGASVTVATPTTVLIDVSATVELSKLEGDIEAITELFSEALKRYIGGIAFLESEVLISRVGSVLINTPGVSDYTELKICGVSQNLLLEVDELPSVGEIKLTVVEG